MLNDTYKKFFEGEKDDEEAAFSMATRLLENSQCTIDEINQVIEKHSKDPFIGIFVSAAINACKHPQIIVHSKGADYLCYRLDIREVTLIGNAGKCLGYEMISGAILIKGSCGDRAGARMRGGKIVVEGDAGDLAGNRMDGGELEIHGKAGMWAGAYMNGGKITINGECGKGPGEGRNGGELIVAGRKI